MFVYSTVLCSMWWCKRTTNSFIGPNIRRSGHNPLQPLQPRFDPLGPSPDHIFRPGRGGGMRNNRGMFGRMGGPRFF